MNGVIALPCNLLHYLVLSQHLHQPHSLTAQNLFPDVHDTYWSLLEGLILINHKLSSIHHESDPGCTSGAWRHGIPRAHSTNSMVAPTDMQPCPPSRVSRKAHIPQRQLIPLVESNHSSLRHHLQEDMITLLKL